MHCTWSLKKLPDCFCNRMERFPKRNFSISHILYSVSVSTRMRIHKRCNAMVAAVIYGKALITILKHKVDTYEWNDLFQFNLFLFCQAYLSSLCKGKLNDRKVLNEKKIRCKFVFLFLKNFKVPLSLLWIYLTLKPNSIWIWCTMHNRWSSSAQSYEKGKVRKSTDHFKYVKIKNGSMAR